MTRTRTRKFPAAGLLVVVAAIAVGLGYQSLASSLPTAASPLHGAGAGAGSGEAGGALPRGTTVFDDDVPGVANLDPALLAALRAAAAEAARDGVRFYVDSGWRSRAYQERLFREAVARYGSVEAAARWVATPGRSAHVSGDAVDIAPAAAAWLSVHGAAYGLCQIYANESWHYELRPEAADHGCPPMYADASRGPT